MAQQITILKGDMSTNTVGVQGPIGKRGLPAFFQFWVEDGYLYVDEVTEDYEMYIDEDGNLVAN